MITPTERDVKVLFARSMNRCAFPACAEAIVQTTGTVTGEICHIRAKSPGGPRYDSTQVEAERNSYNNLILLCANHHKIVDSEPEKFTVDLLTEFKEIHERNGGVELNREEANRARKLLDSYLDRIEIDSNRTTITQVANGTKITQVAGNYYQSPPKTEVIITPPVGAVSPADLDQIAQWIEDLVDKTTGMSKSGAFGMWRNRFKHRFKLTKSEQLLSAQMQEAKEWYVQQMAILNRGLKTKAPDAWRKARYTAIHAAIREMGVDKVAYYQEIAARLKRKPFQSLTELTKIDLERVYSMVLRDAKTG